MDPSLCLDNQDFPFADQNQITSLACKWGRKFKEASNFRKSIRRFHGRVMKPAAQSSPCLDLISADSKF